MPRALKPHKISTFLHSRGRKRYDLMLDRESKTFFVKIPPNQRVEASSAAECEKLAKEALDKLVPFEWKPFIIIDRDATNYTRMHDIPSVEASCNLGFERCEISKNPGDNTKFLKRTHPDDLHEHWSVEQREDWANGLITHQHWPTDTDHVCLPYAEEVWQGLMRMVVSLDAQQEYIRQLFKKPEDVLTNELTRVGMSGPHVTRKEQDR